MNVFVAALLAVLLVEVGSERIQETKLDPQLFFTEPLTKITQIRNYLDDIQNYKQSTNFFDTLFSSLVAILGPLLSSFFGALIGPLLSGLGNSLASFISGNKELPSLLATNIFTLPAESIKASGIGLNSVSSTEETGSTKYENEPSYSDLTISESIGNLAIPQNGHEHANENPSSTASNAPFYVPLLIAPLNGVNIHPFFYHRPNSHYYSKMSLKSTNSTKLPIKAGTISGILDPHEETRRNLYSDINLASHSKEGYLPVRDEDNIQDYENISKPQ